MPQNRSTSSIQIRVVAGDPVEVTADALVVPTNSTGEMTEGFALALRQRGGHDIERQVKRYAPIAIGAAVITDGGLLPVRNLIHVPVAEEPRDKASTEAVRKATRAALIAAMHRSLSVLAMPFMCRPPTELSAAEVARAMVDELRSHKHSLPATVYLADTRPEIISLFGEMLRVVQ